MAYLHCPDCGVKGRLSPERDEDGELIGYECDGCHMLFEDVAFEEGED